MRYLPDWEYAILVLLTCAISVALLYVGNWLAVVIAWRRRRPLLAYLGDPERG